MYEFMYVSTETQRAELDYRHAALAHDYGRIRRVRPGLLHRRRRAANR